MDPVGMILYNWFLFPPCSKERHPKKNFTPKKKLVGGWTNPFEKYARQIGSFPQVGANIKEYLKPPPSLIVTS